MYAVGVANSYCMILKLRVSYPKRNGRHCWRGDRVTKADIVERVSVEVGVTKKIAFECVEQIFELLKNTLENSDKVKISGFGNFIVREKADRRGRNPQTGKEIVIRARRVLSFKPSPILKKSLNAE